MDKAAIAWTIGIVAVAAGIAVMGVNAGESTPVATYTPSQMQDITEPIQETKSMDEPMQDMTEPESAMGPQTVIVTIPLGTSVPGCEDTNECYTPASVSVNVGDTVRWDNIDTVAHTVTSGIATSGPDGEFDSSLLMGGNIFENTFDSAGSYDYFCIVHPWMIGDVQVS